MDVKIILDIIAVAVVAEAGIIAWLRVRQSRTGALSADVANLASGFCLLLAVRFAVSGDIALVLALVALSGVAHAFDLRRRLRS